MEEKKSFNGDFTEKLKSLEVGESATFPIEKLLSVRALASSQGMMLGRKFATNGLAEERVVVVRRLS